MRRCIPWAIQTAKESIDDVLSFRYEEHMESNIEDVRKKLKINAFKF